MVNYESFSMADINWISPPDPVQIEPSQVHVWRLIRPTSDEQNDSYQEILSSQEMHRANRFHNRVDRDRFIMNHIVLRRILSWYLDIAPGTIEFAISPVGKPTLIETQNPQPIDFNLSHSGNMLLVAITLNRLVGIDVELIKPLPDMAQMVELYFSRSENSVFLALPEHERTHAFYSAWTRKEAYLKLIGEGLQLAPDRIEVSLNPEDVHPWLRIREEAHPQLTSHLFSFQPADEYQAALAVEGENWDVIPIQYPR
jgi:4'-phosphopantetheinyl transferase